MEWLVANCNHCLAGEVRGSKSQAEGTHPPLEHSEKGGAQRRAAQTPVRKPGDTASTRARAESIGETNEGALDPLAMKQIPTL
jgi:hypothetical protein